MFAMVPSPMVSSVNSIRYWSFTLTDEIPSFSP